MRSARFGLLLYTLLLNIPVWAQAPSSSPPQPSDPQAVAVVQTTIIAPKDLEAVTIVQSSLSTMGWQNLTALQTAQAQGTLTLLGDSPIDFPIILKSRGSKQERTELTSGKGVRLFLVNNGRGIIRYPDGSIKRLSDDNMVFQRTDYIPVLSLISEFDQSDIAVEHMADSTLGASAVHVVAVSLYSGQSKQDAEKLQARTRMSYFIDAKTNLVLKTSQSNYTENDPSESQRLDTYFSDYRNVGGIMVPFHQEVLADDKPFLTVVFDSVSFGIAVQDSDFSVD